jgi:predicted amidohydrolase
VWSKNHYDKNTGFEYDMAIYVANWPAVRKYPWRSLLVARAIENMACIIGVNRIGKDNSGISYNGDTMIIDAKGNVLFEADDGKEHNISYTFVAKELVDFRRKFNVGFDWDDFKIIS